MRNKGLMQGLNDMFGRCIGRGLNIGGHSDANHDARVQAGHLFAVFFGKKEANNCRRTAPRLAINIGKFICSATAVEINRSPASA